MDIKTTQNAMKFQDQHILEKVYYHVITSM